MMGSGPNPGDVVQLVEQWRPKKAYRSEPKFQNDLQDWLDQELNRGGGGLLGGGGGHVVVAREHGQVNADVAVGDEIGIELKRDLTNSQKKKLRGQIEEYLDDYPTVIVVACGIDDMDGWRDLQNTYQQGGGGFGGNLGMGGGQVFFVHKRKEKFGDDPRGGGGGDWLFGGGDLFR